MSSSSSSSSACRPPALLPSFTLFDFDTAYAVDVPITPATFQDMKGESIKAVYLRNVEFPESMEPFYETLIKLENLTIFFLLQNSFSEKQTKEFMNFLTRKKEIVRLDIQECTFSVTSLNIIFASIKDTGLKALSLNFPIPEEYFASHPLNISTLSEFYLPGNRYSASLVAHLLTQVPSVAIQSFEKERSHKRPSELSIEEYDDDRKLYIYDQGDTPTAHVFAEANVGVKTGSLVTKVFSKECVQILNFIINPSHRLEDKIVKVFEIKDDVERNFLYSALIEEHFIFYPSDSIADSISRSLTLTEDEFIILNSHLICSIDGDRMEAGACLKMIAEFFRNNQRPIQIHHYDRNNGLYVSGGKIQTDVIYGDFGDNAEIVEIYSSLESGFYMDRRPS